MKTSKAAPVVPPPTVETPTAPRRSYLLDDINEMAGDLVGAAAILSMCGAECDEVADALVLVERTLLRISERLDDCEGGRS